MSLQPADCAVIWLDIESLEVSSSFTLRNSSSIAIIFAWKITFFFFSYFVSCVFVGLFVCLFACFLTFFSLSFNTSNVFRSLVCLLLSPGSSPKCVHGLLDLLAPNVHSFIGHHRRALHLTPTALCPRPRVEGVLCASKCTLSVNVCQWEQTNECVKGWTSWLLDDAFVLNEQFWVWTGIFPFPFTPFIPH